MYNKCQPNKKCISYKRIKGTKMKAAFSTVNINLNKISFQAQIEHLHMCRLVGYRLALKPLRPDLKSWHKKAEQEKVREWGIRGKKAVQLLKGVKIHLAYIQCVENVRMWNGVKKTKKKRKLSTLEAHSSDDLCYVACFILWEKNIILLLKYLLTVPSVYCEI